MNQSKSNSQEERLELILQRLEEYIEKCTSGSEANPFRLYDNKAMMKILGVDGRYLKTLRDNGLLSHSRHRDKFWYTQDDLEKFLQSCRYEAFNQKGGAV